MMDESSIFQLDCSNIDKMGCVQWDMAAGRDPHEPTSFRLWFLYGNHHPHRWFSILHLDTEWLASYNQFKLCDSMFHQLVFVDDVNTWCPLRRFRIRSPQSRCDPDASCL